MVQEMLKPGKGNAISTEVLLKVLDLNSARQLRQIIENERRSGAVILSSCKGGYFLPENKEEIAEYIRTQERKAKSLLFTLKSAKKQIKKFEGQMNIKDYTEGEKQNE